MQNEDNKVVVIPLTPGDIERLSFVELSQILVMYFDDPDKINIGRPSLEPYMPAMANMYGFYDAKNRAVFMMLSGNFAPIAESLAYHPVYEVTVSDEMTVKSAQNCFGVAIPLIDVLNGKYRVGDESFLITDKVDRTRKL